MRAIFVDCTEELARVIDNSQLSVPETIHVNHGSPSEAELIELCAQVSVAAFFDGPLSKNFDGLPTSASRAL